MDRFFEIQSFQTEEIKYKASLFCCKISFYLFKIILKRVNSRAPRDSKI